MTTDQAKHCWRCLLWETWIWKFLKHFGQLESLLLWKMDISNKHTKILRGTCYYSDQTLSPEKCFNSSCPWYMWSPRLAFLETLNPPPHKKKKLQPGTTLVYPCTNKRQYSNMSCLPSSRGSTFRYHNQAHNDAQTLQDVNTPFNKYNTFTHWDKRITSPPLSVGPYENIPWCS